MSKREEQNRNCSEKGKKKSKGGEAGSRRRMADEGNGEGTLYNASQADLYVLLCRGAGRLGKGLRSVVSKESQWEVRDRELELLGYLKVLR